MSLLLRWDSKRRHQIPQERSVLDSRSVTITDADFTGVGARKVRSLKSAKKRSLSLLILRAAIKQRGGDTIFLFRQNGPLGLGPAKLRSRLFWRFQHEWRDKIFYYFPDSSTDLDAFSPKIKKLAIAGVYLWNI